MVTVAVRLSASLMLKVCSNRNKTTYWLLSAAIQPGGDGCLHGLLDQPSWFSTENASTYQDLFVMDTLWQPTPLPVYIPFHHYYSVPPTGLDLSSAAQIYIIAKVRNMKTSPGHPDPLDQSSLPIHSMWRLYMVHVQAVKQFKKHHTTLNVTRKTIWNLCLKTTTCSNSALLQYLEG